MTACRLQWHEAPGLYKLEALRDSDELRITAKAAVNNRFAYQHESRVDNW